jgi:hypothetical protein
MVAVLSKMARRECRVLVVSAGGLMMIIAMGMQAANVASVVRMRVRGIGDLARKLSVESRAA